MIDRNGLEYERLLEMQETHLAMWRKRLLGVITNPIAEYVRRHNRPATTAQDKHQVYRGQDIVEIIMRWPEPDKYGYPPIKEEKYGAELI